MSNQTNTGEAANTAQPQKISERRLQQILKVARRKVDRPSYEEARKARKLLLPIIEQFRDWRMRAEAQAIIGESYFVNECYSEARIWLEKPGSKETAHHMRLLADTLNHLGDHRQAASYYRQLLNMYEQLHLNQALEEHLSSMQRVRRR